MRLNSLAFRLFATALGWTVLVLPVAGLIIDQLYRQETEAGFDDRLRTLLTVVLADSIDHTGQEPSAPQDVGEPLFEIAQSGWYWQIQPLDEPARATLVSPSLATGSLASPFLDKVAPDTQGVRWLTGEGPSGQPLRIAEMIYTLGDETGGPRYSFIVAGPLEWLEARIAGFRTRLASALALAGLGLVVVTLFQVRFGLLPLRAIERGLAGIRSGHATKLDGELPAEIEPLQTELNALIQSNQDIIERARTQVGNLAHALKTPLAVITNEARDDRGPLGAKIAGQADLMRDQINTYLERARIAARVGAIGRATEVAPVLASLSRALERIYSERDVTIEIDCPHEARFEGEKQDFEEMLGNLLDNACKWAQGRVEVAVSLRAGNDQSKPGAAGRRLAIVVEDDGPGLSAHDRARIGKRGFRLDESKPGTGLGLSIVSDLVQSYRGSLALEAGAHGGLRVRLDLPAA